MSWYSMSESQRVRVEFLQKCMLVKHEAKLELELDLTSYHCLPGAGDVLFADG